MLGKGNAYIPPVQSAPLYGAIPSPNEPDETMSSPYSKLVSLVEGLESDVKAFYEKGNKAAGTRVRKGMQELKAMAQEIRTAVQEKKGA